SRGATVQGQVVDENRNPVPGITVGVIFLDFGIGATPGVEASFETTATTKLPFVDLLLKRDSARTNTDGTFQVDQIPPGMLIGLTATDNKQTFGQPMHIREIDA